MVKLLKALEEAKRKEAEGLNTTRNVRDLIYTCAEYRLSVDDLQKVEESVIAARYVDTIEPQPEAAEQESRTEPKPTTFWQQARHLLRWLKSGGSIVEPLIQKE